MGQRLTEQGVAETMGTSAGPVREAFARLTADGLLMSLPNRGTFVSSVSEEEARGAYGVRKRVEMYAFELARDRLTPDANRELDQLILELKASALKSDYPAMISIDMRFHGIFYAHSGNPILIAIWPMLEATIRKFVSVAGPVYTRDFNESALRHERLLANYRKGDMDAVAKELQQHGQDLWRNLSPPEDADASQPTRSARSAGDNLP